MDSNSKINVRGAINALRVRGKLELPTDKYIPSSVRVMASSVRTDTGKRFSVSVSEKTITITRKS